MKIGKYLTIDGGEADIKSIYPDEGIAVGYRGVDSLGVWRTRDGAYYVSGEWWKDHPMALWMGSGVDPQQTKFVVDLDVAKANLGWEDHMLQDYIIGTLGGVPYDGK